MLDRRDFAADVAARALKNGAEHAEVYIVEDRSLSMEVRLGRVETIENAGSIGLGLRVVRGGASALSSTRDLTPSSVDELLVDTLALAAVTDPDADVGLPQPADMGAFPGDLDLCDTSIALLSLEERQERARIAEAAGLDADARVVNSSGAFWRDRHCRVTLANSSGFASAYEGTSAAVGVSLVAEAGGVKQTDGWFTSARHLSDLEAPQAVGEEAARRALRKLGARSLSPRTTTVIFDPDTAADLLKIMSGAASAASVHRRTSFLVDRLGDAVAAPEVQIVDDATVRRGLRSRPFDAEGVRSRRTPIVEGGVLGGYLADAYYGRKLGVRSTASADRVFCGPPEVGHSNLLLLPGSHSPEAIFKAVGTGLYVTRLYWVGINPVTGDLSRGAEGLWIEGGEPVHAVQEITVAGNILTMLKNVIMIGDDPSTRTAISAPTIAVRDVAIGGR